MSAQKSIMTSSLNFQNSYVRCKIGEPVVPVLKSIQTTKRQTRNNCENVNEELNNRIVSNSNTNDFVIKEPTNSLVSSNRIPSPPVYLANKIYGEEMLLPIQGYFCRICESFFDTHDKAYQEHCATKSHYENYIKFYNEALMLQRSVDQHCVSLEKHNNLIDNQLPIKIKIENIDTFQNNDNIKKPLSERLGAIKKNKSKFSKQLRKQLNFFDGDYNNSILHLPKPSSHITPSRKVFLDDYNIKMKSNFGQNTYLS